MSNCIYFRSVSKFNKKIKCEYICGNTCRVVKEYKRLLNEGKIDIIYDIAHFRDGKHQNNDERSVNNGSSNKSNTKRTLPNGRKKFKSKSK